MGNFKMNLFEHYRQEGCFPIENNISRILARILNDNVCILNGLIRKINEKSSISVEYVDNEYNVDFQTIVSNIDVDRYNRIIGVALTAEELPNVEELEVETNDNLITDIIIENLKDTLIIIEVKRTNEDCMYQLEKQIQSIINGKDISSEKVSLTWEDIVELLENYKNSSKIQDVLVNDYYDYLKRHFKQWFPVASIQDCINDKERLNKRIERLHQNIQELFKVEKEDKNWIWVNNWGWTQKIGVRIDENNLCLIIEMFARRFSKTIL